MKYSFAIVVAALLIIHSTNVFAWGAKGHKLVARIAVTQLKPAVKDSIEKYLDKMNIEDAANWMDEVRGDHSFDYQSQWHYINIEKGHNYSDTSTNNVVWAIHQAIYEIQHRGNYSKAEIALDIKRLLHLVGDIHQPLHCGYPADQGANTIIVYIDQASSNLHRVWDTNILENYILNEPITWANLSTFPKEEIEQIKDTSVVDWMNESRSYLDEIYDFKGDNINKQYIQRNVPIIEKRVLYAGIRLGRLLNRLFS